MGKRQDPWMGSARPRPLADLERKLACAQGGYHDPAARIGRIRQVVTPAAERDQLTQVEVGVTGDCLITW